MTGEGGLWQENEDFDRRRRTMAREGGLWQNNKNFGRMRKYVRRRRELDLEG